MKSAEQMQGEIESSLLIDRLVDIIESESWCMDELGKFAGRNKRWVQRKLRGDTQMTLAEFFTIAAVINWRLEISEVTK